MLDDEERKARDRERWHKRVANPETRALLLARRTERRRLRWSTDADYRDKLRASRRAARRASYHGDPDARAGVLLANDRYRRNNWEKVKARRNAQRAERRRNDPEYAARLRGQKRRDMRRARRAEQAALFDAVSAAIPKSYPQYVRDDIAGEIFLALAERRLRRSQIVSRVKEFTTAYWRDNSPFATVSLDAPAYQGGPALVDLIAGEAGADVDQR